MYKLYNGDCLEIMDKLIEQSIKVDMIFTDIPYGTTSRNKWDEIIPFEQMWKRINKLIISNAKDKTMIIVTHYPEELPDIIDKQFRLIRQS